MDVTITRLIRLFCYSKANRFRIIHILRIFRQNNLPPSLPFDVNEYFYYFEAIL